MRKKRTARNRAAEAIAKAERAIILQGWKYSQQGTRFVGRKVIHEREDESTTTLYESDYTIEGLAANVARREREEGRK